MESAYEFLVSNLDETGYLPADKALRLPDHGAMARQDSDCWVPGALEGTLLRSPYDIREKTLVNFKIARAVKKQINKPSPENRRKMLDTLSSYYAISIVDPALSFLHAPSLNKEAMRAEALHLVKGETGREYVKLGIALLGQCGRPEDAEVLRIMACHEEFTLFAAVALKNILPQEEINSLLIGLAEHLSGWGKIAILYELDYSDESAREWTLRRGCYNSIALSYLANVCAVKGKMVDKLESFLGCEDKVRNEFDEELYNGICDIFEGLLEKHPTNDDISQFDGAKRSEIAFKWILSVSDFAEDERGINVVRKLDKIFGG